MNNTNEHTLTPNKVNPLLQRIQMPGETFSLPSGGLFYTNGELDSSVGSSAEVRVHPMTAIDEIVMKTPDMLFSGDAIRQVFSRCIPQVANVDNLLAKDVDFLLVCLRKVSYGNDIQLEHTHNCASAKKHSYVVNINEFIQKSKRIDPTKVATEFNVDMPNGQTVSIHPIRFVDFIRVMQTSTGEDSQMNAEKVKDFLVESITNIITRVDDISDKDMIREWVDKVAPSYRKKISEKMEETLDWGPEFTTTVKCQDCGEMVEIVVPMNPLSFFI